MSRHAAVPAVYGILQKNDSILLIQRQNTGYYDGWWYLPAGHVEAGELPVRAAVRELKEEIGVTVQPADIQFAHVMYRPKRDETGERVDLFFSVEHWEGDIENREPEKCSAVTWFPLDALPQNIAHHVRHALDCIQRGLLYSEGDYYI